MCCFSRPVPFVGRTRIFGRRLGPTHQALAYAMDVELAEDAAMVLPLPVPSRVGDDDVRFIDLSGYPTFFDDALAGFRELTFAPLSRGGPPEKPKLTVHAVGEFVASFVPRAKDFDRLDPRFRLDQETIRALPSVEEAGFAVFQLAARHGGLFRMKRERQSVHPMAFVFPTRDEDTLFFPTVHVHDGSVPEHADFDHQLVCQDESVLGRTLPWEASGLPLGAHVRADATGGLVDGAQVGRMTALLGRRANRDTVLSAPRGITVAELSATGRSFRVALGAKAHFGFFGHLPQGSAWRRSASDRLGSVRTTLLAALAELESGSVPGILPADFDANAAPYFLNGRALWSGATYMDGKPAAPGGRGVLRFQAMSDHVEPQSIELTLEAMPDPATLEALLAYLARALDRGANAA